MPAGLKYHIRKIFWRFFFLDILAYCTCEQYKNLLAGRTLISTKLFWRRNAQRGHVEIGGYRQGEREENEGYGRASGYQPTLRFKMIKALEGWQRHSFHAMP
jgi:hypothetical protein